jgi:FkbM family methyltransferase
MPDNNFANLRNEAESLIDQGKNQEALVLLSKATSDKLANWEIYWLMARAGKNLGNLEVVDLACKAVLELNKEFWFARELPKHARGYYSQLEQDKIIEKFFAEHPPQSRIFVEVGAFDGVHYSNVRRLQEKYGWNGISIEPVEKNFNKLKKSYEGVKVVCVRCAVGDKEGVAELNVSSYPHLPEWGSDVATFSELETHKWQQLYGATWHKELVPVKTLTAILKDSAINTVDFLSVDAEGHDLDVLKGLDFSVYKPALIIVEYNKHRQEIFDFLTDKGYRLLKDNGQDLFMEFPEEKVNGTIRSSVNRITMTNSLEVSPYLERVRKTLLCHDCCTIPKVSGAGRVVLGSPPRQIMHNGIEIIHEAFHGKWMSEIIEKLRGHHEPQEERVFHEVLSSIPANATMIELGSFWAYYSMWFNKAIKNARNFLIEPNPKKLALGQEHFRLNNMTGDFTHAFVGRDSSDNSMFEDWDGKLIKVPRVSIDDFLVAHGIEFLHVLHADIQGAEYEMLMGCKKSIAAGKIGYIFISIHGDCYDKCLLFLKERGFTVIASHTIAESYSADGLLVVASPHVASIPPVSISVFDPQQSAKNADLVTFSDIRNKLNPHLLALGTLPRDKTIRRATSRPGDLLSCDRFDLIPKLLYASFRESCIDSPWARNLYKAHLEAFNGLHEGDGSGKSGLEAFLTAFDTLLDSLKDAGFNPEQSLVPLDRNGVVIDGAHRVAACMLFDIPVETLQFDMQSNNYNYEYFLQKGLDPDLCDAIALKYCRINPNSYIVTVFPSAVGKEEELRTILSRYAEIFYDRKVLLSKLGSINLVRQIYNGEPWVGNFADQFAGAQNKAAECFRSDGPVRVYVITTNDFENVKTIKQQIRDLFGISNHSVHINDTHQETVMLGQLLLNRNSIHFLNNAKLTTFPKFQAHLENYKKVLMERGVQGEYLCIDGSASMAAYGIREARDLDYLHFGYDDLTFDYPPELIGSHNTEIGHHVTTRDDIIFNPRNHFYYDGVKFASLGIIRALKQKRGEPKDFEDVALIDQLVNTPPALPHVYSPAISQHGAERTDDAAKATKIVGLVPARNERHLISQCLRALSLFTDAIVYLDDASTDETVQIVESLRNECNIERIIRKNEWLRDEPGDRNLMLQAGREIGGTHFIVLDADEMLSSNLLDNANLTEAIRKLQPGDRLALNWIQLWRSIDEYRFDNSVWTWNYKEIIFCDDARCSYSSEFIHTPRVPDNLTGRGFKLEGYFAGLLHFQFVNWRNLLIKQAWYRCLERIREPNKSVEEINQRYAPSIDETGLGLKPSPRNWFYGYPFFDRTVFDLPEKWREKQILGWFDQYGRDYFAGLDIWDKIQYRLAGQVTIGNLEEEPPAKKLATSNSENNRPGSSDTSKVATLRSNLEYWKEMQNKGYFENQNQALLKDFGEEKYQKFYGTTDPKKPRNTSEKDREHIARFVTLDRSMTAAIIGCGYGRETLAIAPQVKHVYGIDVNHTILDKAQDFLASNNVYNFTPVLAENWRTLTPPYLDFVYSITVFQHLTKDLVIDYLIGLSEKLTPEGTALCQFAELRGGTSDADLKVYEPSVNWTVAEIDTVLHDAGLEVISVSSEEIPDRGFWHWAFFKNKLQKAASN